MDFNTDSLSWSSRMDDIPRRESSSSFEYSASRTSSFTSWESLLPTTQEEKSDRKLSIDGDRLWREIHHTSQWGAIESSLGMARLSLSDNDRKVRDYFVREASELGCDVQVDQIGNIFAILPGQCTDTPPIGMGSHLDTQPAGGRFDGILGVLAGLEVLRTIKKSGIRTYAPLAAIDWTNEEGARFMPGCNGSAVWAGHIPLSDAHNLLDVQNNCTMKDELKRIGYLGKVPASSETRPLSAHFELHIEQRRLLQDNAKSIGTVQGIQGIRWYKLKIHGQRAHGGSTPMAERADALVVAAKIITFLDQKASHAYATATVGVVDLERPSANTIPGLVDMTMDIRHPCEKTIDEIEGKLQEYMTDLAAEDDRIECVMTRIWHSPAANFDKTAVACTREAALSVVGSDLVVDTISLAGHDSALVSQKVPTSMIFVPSKDGISHAPEEFTSKDECTAGAQVLLEAVLNFDTHLRMQASSSNDRDVLEI